MGLKCNTEGSYGWTTTSLTCKALKVLRVPAIAVLLCSMFGCSLSYSSGSISDSISSSFKSVSDSISSSSPEGRAASYAGDVRDYTESYVRSSSDVAGFKNGLASIASKHGISNWEADMNTFSGIGEGLAKAKATQMQVEVFKTNLSGGDAAKATAIQNGYEKGKR